MSIASEILRIQQAKQAIKEAINNKGGALVNEKIEDYATAIDNIPSGGSDYEDYARTLYLEWGKSSQFATAWQKQIDSKNVIYDIDVTLVAPNQDMGGMYLDLYMGNSDLTQLYNDCVNEVIPLPSSEIYGDIYLINNVALKYYGDISDAVGFPIPLFEFGSMDGVNGFIIGDLTPLEMGLGITLAKITSVTIPNNKLTIQQGFDFEEPSGIILPDSVISIDVGAFSGWESNNQPLVIPNSVTSIGMNAFEDWTSNNQPLVIPNSVTSIGEYAFYRWESNNQPLVIPNSVTSIVSNVFSGWESNNQPLVIPNGVTRIQYEAFSGWESNNQPLVIPNSVTSIEDYAFKGWLGNNQPLVISNSVTDIGSDAFYGWTANNQPLVIPNSVTVIYSSAFHSWSSNNQPLVIPHGVTSIGMFVFENWTSNNQPLVIPNSVTSIASYAFDYWSSNNKPLVIPNSVTSISNFAFNGWSLVPYVEMQRTTPPTLGHANAFSSQNNAPIYVPDASVTAYKTATNWISLASRIFPVSDKQPELLDIKQDIKVAIENKGVDMTGVDFGGYAEKIDDIPLPKEEQSKIVSPTTSSQDVLPDTNKVLSKVTVNAIQTETKSQQPNLSSGNQVINATSGKFMTSFTITKDTVNHIASNIRSGKTLYGVPGNLQPVKEEQTKTVSSPNFSSGNVVVTPDSGKVLTQVTVVKDNDLVPKNIVKDVNIFGVVGTAETVVELTQAQYDALPVYDNNTYYLIVEV